MVKILPPWLTLVASFLETPHIDINIAYTIVWIFIFSIHLKSFSMHMCKK